MHANGPKRVCAALFRRPKQKAFQPVGSNVHQNARPRQPSSRLVISTEHNPDSQVEQPHQAPRRRQVDRQPGVLAEIQDVGILLYGALQAQETCRACNKEAKPQQLFKNSGFRRNHSTSPGKSVRMPISPSAALTLASQPGLTTTAAAPSVSPRQPEALDSRN